MYLTFFYTRHELAVRVGYLFVSAAIAGALGGLLAYGIGHMDGVANMHGWRWILIIEGLPTFFLGILTFFLLPNDAESAYFLTEDEKKLQIARHAREYGMTTSARQFSKADMMKAFKDWKVWLFCVAQFGADTMLYGKFLLCDCCHLRTYSTWLGDGASNKLAGYSTFLPTIISGLGHWSTAQVQLLTIPCYFLGAAAYMSVAYLSDHAQKRGLFCVICGAISIVGYGILISASAAGVHYFGYDSSILIRDSVWDLS